MSQKLMLGNRELSQVEITVLSVAWEEVPKQLGNDIKARANKKCYLTLDADNLRALVRFYDGVMNGDICEGISSTKQYYEIIGYNVGVFNEMKDIAKAVEQGWSVYTTDVMFDGAKYLVIVY